MEGNRTVQKNLSEDQDEEPQKRSDGFGVKRRMTKSHKFFAYPPSSSLLMPTAKEIICWACLLTSLGMMGTHRTSVSLSLSSTWVHLHYFDPFRIPSLPLLIDIPPTFFPSPFLLDRKQVHLVHVATWLTAGLDAASTT